MKRKIISFIFLFTCILSLPSCSSENPMTKRYSEFFNTSTVIYSYANDSKKEFDANCDAVRELFSTYHKLFDIYNEYDGLNNLCTVNKNAGISPVKADKVLLDFVEYSIDICKLTDLETNIAMGSVLSLWHKAREVSIKSVSQAYIPSQSSLDLASQHISIDSIIVDREASTVYISDKSASIDVGAIAKGYAVEAAAKLLEKRDVDGYVINSGGNIRAIGKKSSGESFITGITNPEKDPEKPFALRIHLSDTSCVTSGDYERFYSVNGVKYHHIIDKDTLMPSAHFASVTVICSDAALADALSTALFCMNHDDGSKLVSNFEGVDALWIFKDGQMKMTDGFHSLILQ